MEGKPLHIFLKGGLKKMKFKIVMVLIVMLVLVINVPVYADTDIPDPPEIGYEYWVIRIRDHGTIDCLFSHNPITVTTNEERLRLDGFVSYVYKDGQWEFQSSWDKIEYLYFATIYNANHDVAYEDGSGFFFLAPKVPLIYPIVKMMDFGKILRNFSAGLIPIVGLIILSIGLKKALGFLRSQLME